MAAKENENVGGINSASNMAWAWRGGENVGEISEKKIASWRRAASRRQWRHQSAWRRRKYAKRRNRGGVKIGISSAAARKIRRGENGEKWRKQRSASACIGGIENVAVWRKYHQAKWRMIVARNNRRGGNNGGIKAWRKAAIIGVWRAIIENGIVSRQHRKSAAWRGSISEKRGWPLSRRRMAASAAASVNNIENIS
jgi:hypothetical protein